MGTTNPKNKKERRRNQDRTMCMVTFEFPTRVGLHQGSAINAIFCPITVYNEILHIDVSNEIFDDGLEVLISMTSQILKGFGQIWYQRMNIWSRKMHKTVYCCCCGLGGSAVII
eukprot:TRINITY_DN10025_c1_g2_i2.p1 TRINITY_DN10025_c1_g2~~TRINITY_DN10025_c1_g2_i2.p1  ORF type:complete len:114 (+),score=14.39 TRINITY_DN10025_c1_g2_i2:1137-1478(+)